MSKVSIALPPITITKTAPPVPVPVRLSTLEIDPALDLALVVVYSDGTQKVIVSANDDSVYKTAGQSYTGFMVSDGCENIRPYLEDLPSEYEGETIEASFYWGNCQMDGNVPKGAIIMEFDDYQAVYDASENQEDTNLEAPLADWDIREQ